MKKERNRKRTQANEVVASVHGVSMYKAKSVEQNLRQVYGYGGSKIAAVCHALGLTPSVPLGRLSRDQLSQRVGRLRVKDAGGDRLKHQEQESLKRMQRSEQRRGRFIRLRKGLPVNGGRTRGGSGKTARKLNPGRIRSRGQ